MASHGSQSRAASVVTRSGNIPDSQCIIQSVTLRNKRKRHINHEHVSNLGRSRAFFRLTVGEVLFANQTVYAFGLINDLGNFKIGRGAQIGIGGCSVYSH